MIDTIYIEEAILDTSSTQRILKRYPRATTILCSHYGEIFNRQGQNFRLQKKSPSLILAKKQGRLLHKVPDGYGIGRPTNYYFSHLLNCPFDCGYCFLQGMYPSAHYVLFVNYEDFQEDILKIKEPSVTFFTGYDGDSIAFEPTSGFLQTFLPFMKKHPSFEFELRTKSIAIRPLLTHKPLDNCVVAFSLNPQIVTKTIERKTPPLFKRLEAIETLSKAGWPIGLRFDPIIYHNNFEETYAAFFKEVFSRIDESKIHSVTLGAFRAPPTTEKKLIQLLPQDPLLASNQRVDQALSFAKSQINKYLTPKKLFCCSL